MVSSGGLDIALAVVVTIVAQVTVTVIVVYFLVIGVRAGSAWFTIVTNTKDTGGE